MKILLAVDGSAYTQKMLSYLVSHAELLAPTHQYTALTVEGALPPRARSVLSKEDLELYYREEADKILNPVRDFLAQHGVQANGMASVGPVGETIAKIAEDGQYDLLVMGTHGHGALGKLVMGSVSTQVLAHSTVPVLLVR
ncbi:universal stress protein [Comamonas endophytica]|uniref:Universal stress protein n=1 Tax=Comamonas endophytica TaxID=2949090 RepID=A0ABY6GFS0_9BURK|nr:MULTISPECIES: universal stress protein [unclassified Acidovorax]MCD2512476.1 universal stress protein [Acidovorax sp. D4N7]UYG53155.1 universal stress protein [Acidovorax sp. 5MLIR]